MLQAMTVLLGVRPRAMGALLGVERLRRVGEGVPRGKERVAEAVAAAPGRHGVALLHGVEAAGGDRGGHVLAAILVRRGLCRRRDRHEGRGGQRDRGRRSQFQKMLHLALSSLLCVAAFRPRVDLVRARRARRACMPDALSHLLFVRTRLQSYACSLSQRVRVPKVVCRPGAGRRSPRSRKQNRFSRRRDACQKIRNVTAFEVYASCNELRAADCDGAATKARNSVMKTVAEGAPSIAPWDRRIYGSVTLR